MADRLVVTRVANGTFLVAVGTDGGDKREIVYVAATAGSRWAFWDGRVFQSDDDQDDESRRASRTRGHVAHALTAPMPATVLKVLVTPGTRVKKAQPLVVLEAMKMEWPVRALEDGLVKAVHCREGDLVRADQALVDME